MGATVAKMAYKRRTGTNKLRNQPITSSGQSRAPPHLWVDASTCVQVSCAAQAACPVDKLLVWFYRNVSLSLFPWCLRQ